MNNTELENKVQEILNNENFFDMIIAAKNFEKDYKTSDFYKETKMSLTDVIKEAKVFYELKLDNLFKHLQEKMNNLDFEHFYDLITQAGDMFGVENEEIRQVLEDYKTLKM